MKNIKIYLMLLPLFISCSKNNYNEKLTLANENKQIPVLGWHGLPASGELSDIKYYKEMANAGFTINLPLGGWSETQTEPYFELLDKALSVGIKIMVDWKVVNFFTTDEMQRLIKHPALAGYCIRDEPSAKDFPSLAEAVNKIQSVDAVHPPYINLFPNYANAEQLGVTEPDSYRKHVRQYIKEVNVPVISYDHYCILLNAEKKRYIRPEYYENLEIIAEESRNAGKPFWAFALATAHWDYPVPTLSDLRLQVFSDLAYGAQCIQFFTWVDPCCDEMWGEGADDNAPVRIDGTKSPIYYTVQAMNREIKALSKVFLNCKVIWTAHTGNIPKGCKELNKNLLPDIIKTLEISGSGALVSLIENNNQQYLVLVNHDIEQDISITVKGDSKLKMLNKQGLSTKITEHQTVTPGDIVILTWNN